MRTRVTIENLDDSSIQNIVLEFDHFDLSQSRPVEVIRDDSGEVLRFNPSRETTTVITGISLRTRGVE